MNANRAALVRRGLKLNYATLAYNSIEAIVALVAGWAAGSIALIGFGIDSVIELTASGAAQWRLRADLDPVRREVVERYTRRIVAFCFLALAAYITNDAVNALRNGERPDESPIGLALLLVSSLIMPVLAREKGKVALHIGSSSLSAEAKQTSLCAYLSVIALSGVALNALVEWWWADPLAALAMVPIIAMEGVDGIRGERK